MLPHAASSTQKRFLISLALTGLILAAEVAGGLWTGSLALLSDAAHVFMDIFALALSYLALRLSSMPADDRHTYGYHRLEVLAALVNGVSLFVIAGGIFSEAYKRFQAPEPVKSMEMLAIATIGLVVNLVVAFVLGGSHSHDPDHSHGHLPNGTAASTPARPARDLNVQSAFLHVVGDAISSVGVIIAGILITLTGSLWLDPAISVLIGVLILASSYRVLRSSLHILIEGTPEGISLKNVAQTIMDVPGVVSLHDLHVWNICSGRVALSAHVVLEPAYQPQLSAAMASLKSKLACQFGIEHTTVQFETDTCEENPSPSRC